MGAAEEIGKRITEVYAPDYKACAGGIALFFAVLLITSSMIRLDAISFVDAPSIFCVFAGAIGLTLVGGYKGVTAEMLLNRFSKMAVCSGIASTMMGGIGILRNLSNVEYIGPNTAVMLLSIFYGVLFSALAQALIPLTPTALLRKNPLCETLYIN